NLRAGSRRKYLLGTGHGRGRGMQMPAGLGRDFRRQAEQAENEEDVFDACHVPLPDRRLEAAASSRGASNKDLPGDAESGGNATRLRFVAFIAGLAARPGSTRLGRVGGLWLCAVLRAVLGTVGLGGRRKRLRGRLSHWLCDIG